jgi:hypothetical protein
VGGGRQDGWTGKKGEARAGGGGGVRGNKRFEKLGPRPLSQYAALANAHLWKVLRHNCRSVDEARAYKSIIVGDRTVHRTEVQAPRITQVRQCDSGTGRMDGEGWGREGKEKGERSDGASLPHCRGSLGVGRRGGRGAPIKGVSIVTRFGPFLGFYR